MILPRGITGFRHVDEPALPSCDLRAFRDFCHVAARALGGRVPPAEAPVDPAEASYTRVLIELPGGSVAVLLNSHHPVVAFAASPSDNQSGLRFVEAPALADLFRGPGAYTVLSPAETEQPVTAEACRLLGPAELEQLRHWRPRCIGEVVFNRWD